MIWKKILNPAKMLRKPPPTGVVFLFLWYNMGMIDYRARNVQENRLSRVSLRDRKIIELLGRENLSCGVAEQFGMDPAEVVAIAKDLLSGMDIFTELEQRRLLVFQLKSLLSQARRATGQYDN